MSAPKVQLNERKEHSTYCPFTFSTPDTKESPPLIAEKFEWHQFACPTESDMVVQTLLDLADNGYLELQKNKTRIMDFGAGNSEIGKRFANLGFTEVYGQEGSKYKCDKIRRSGYYKEVE